MFVCPLCGSTLKVRELVEYLVNHETGEANTNIGSHALADVLVICTVCDREVSDLFTNEQGELDFEAGVWQLHAHEEAAS